MSAGEARSVYGGAGACIPGKFFKFRCSEINSGTF